MIKRYLADLDARESRVIEDSLHTGHNSGSDAVAEKDGPKRDFQEGMLARLSRFDNSRAAKVITALCWVGMILAAFAAANLMLGRPWF